MSHATTRSLLGITLLLSTAPLVAQALAIPPADAPDFVRRAWAVEAKVRLTNAVAADHCEAEVELRARNAAGELAEAALVEQLAALKQSTAETRRRVRAAKYPELVRWARELLPASEPTASTPRSPQARSRICVCLEAMGAAPGDEECGSESPVERGGAQA